MTRFLVRYYCTTGGAGWGETGQVNHILIKAKNIQSAVGKAVAAMPMGWRINSIKLYDKEIEDEDME